MIQGLRTRARMRRRDGRFRAGVKARRRPLWRRAPSSVRSPQDIGLTEFQDQSSPGRELELRPVSQPPDTARRVLRGAGLHAPQRKRREHQRERHQDRVSQRRDLRNREAVVRCVGIERIARDVERAGRTQRDVHRRSRRECADRLPWRHCDVLRIARSMVRHRHDSRGERDCQVGGRCDRRRGGRSHRCGSHAVRNCRSSRSGCRHRDGRCQRRRGTGSQHCDRRRRPITRKQGRAHGPSTTARASTVAYSFKTPGHRRRSQTPG